MEAVWRTKARRAVLTALAAVYSLFLLLDAAYPACAFSNALKYTGMLLCFTLCALCGREAFSQKHSRLLLFALALTLLADALLLFTSHYVPGILFFCCAHALHIRRISIFWFRAALAAMGIVPLFYIIAQAYRCSLPALLIAAALYAALLLCHTACAFFLAPKQLPARNARMLRAGTLLLFCCDLCVLRCNLPPDTGTLYTAALTMMWAFYLPSQVLLALSALHYDS